MNDTYLIIGSVYAVNGFRIAPPLITYDEESGSSRVIANRTAIETESASTLVEHENVKT